MKKVNIIIADDQIDFLNSLLEELKKQSDFNIVGVAYDGSELLNLLKTINDVDFVITDNQMPKMTGLDVIRTIKKEKQDVPSIFVISGDNIFNECNILDVRFLQKPISIKKIIEIVNNEIEFEESIAMRQKMDPSASKDSWLKKIAKKISHKWLIY